MRDDVRDGMKGGVVGKPLNRIDGRQKVTGTARYAAEFDFPNLAHAVVVQSTIARGVIVASRRARRSGCRAC